VQHFRPDFGWNHHNLMKICSNGCKMVKLDEIFGDKKLVFEKKIAKISIFEKNNSPSGDISPLKKTLNLSERIGLNILLVRASYVGLIN
jgi:hypothetical protein